MHIGSGRVLGEELPALAKEVARVEAVRKYAGKTWTIGSCSFQKRKMILVEVESLKTWILWMNVEIWLSW
jgi:hypothetical protein